MNCKELIRNSHFISNKLVENLVVANSSGLTRSNKKTIKSIKNQNDRAEAHIHLTQKALLSGVPKRV
jgi:hypothetical protein